jgi:hypothetical protein
MARQLVEMWTATLIGEELAAELDRVLDLRMRMGRGMKTMKRSTSATE